MTKEEKKPTLSQETKTQEELKDEQEMKRASMMNPQNPCGRVEDRFGK